MTLLSVQGSDTLNINPLKHIKPEAHYCVIELSYHCGMGTFMRGIIILCYATDLSPCWSFMECKYLFILHEKFGIRF